MYGYKIYKPSEETNRPGLLLFGGPWGSGGGENEREVARRYAELGMVVFLPDYTVVDYQVDENNADQINEVFSNYVSGYLSRAEEVQSVALLALEQLTSMPMVDENKIGVLGFCFGGAMALNLARAGGKATVAVSLHGEYPELGVVTGDSWNIDYFAEMVGSDDPLIKAASQNAWVEELKANTDGTNSDYEFQVWGNSVHVFSIKYSDAFNQAIASAFQSQVTSDGVAGILRYSEDRAVASFDRVDDLFAEYGLIADLADDDVEEIDLVEEPVQYLNDDGGIMYGYKIYRESTLMNRPGEHI